MTMNKTEVVSAKYAGMCNSCGLRIFVGDRIVIVYLNGTVQARHEDCTLTFAELESVSQ